MDSATSVTTSTNWLLFRAYSVLCASQALTYLISQDSTRWVLLYTSVSDIRKLRLKEVSTPSKVKYLVSSRLILSAFRAYA